METRVGQDLFEFWKTLEVFFVQRIDLCLGLLQSGVWLQAPNVVPIVAVMHGLLFVREGQRHPQANFRLNEIEIGGHHAHNGEGPAADAQRAP